LSTARSQQYADDQYIIIYSLVQRPIRWPVPARSEAALTQYTECAAELAKFQKAYPDWNPRIINFRLSYVAGKNRRAEGAAARTKAAAQPLPCPGRLSRTRLPPPGRARDGGRFARTGAGLQAANTTLQAKLKEALAAQPATADSRELEKAQEKISSLMKENDLLKVSLAQGKSRTNSVATAAGRTSCGKRNWR